ncbi:sulfotransferase, partial [Luminiphilus sp.]
EAHNNLGNTLLGLSRLDEAEASYRKAIALKSDYAEAHLNLCEFLEKTNAIDKLLDVLEEARSKTSNMEADFRYYETLAAFRKERYAEAATLVTQIIEDDVGENRRPSYYKLKGDICDRVQDYDAAFAAYESSNQAVKTGLEYQKFRIATDHDFASQENTARQLEQLSIESSFSKRSSHDARQVTFLVGFPRSGTTLLDTILRTHSSIAVIEEQPMVRTMREALDGIEDIRLIETVDHERLNFAKNAYLDELSKHVVGPNKSLTIDKFPLNLLAAPLIHQAFPEAKFILALRHPLDCILSCWMQTFKLNTAMANMVDLDRIVDFYCVAMDIFHLSQKRYGLDVHRIRYEDLTEEFEAETTSVLRFLGLEWESELVNYQATALARRKISTPSHSQVIKPIYKTASYRWRHYENHLEKFKSQLAPWFEEYGY